MGIVFVQVPFFVATSVNFPHCQCCLYLNSCLNVLSFWYYKGTNIKQVNSCFEMEEGNILQETKKWFEICASGSWSKNFHLQENRRGKLILVVFHNVLNRQTLNLKVFMLSQIPHRNCTLQTNLVCKYHFLNDLTIGLQDLVKRPFQRLKKQVSTETLIVSKTVNGMKL